MPYIKDINNRRNELRSGAKPLSAGELNFQIFAYINDVKDEYSEIQILRYVIAFLGDKPNYQRYNDMAGCMMLCRNEIRRRLSIDLDFLDDIVYMYENEIADYEDAKITENGDV